MSIKCFLVTPASIAKLSLRRYESGECPGPYKTYHNAHFALGDVAMRVTCDRWEQVDLDPQIAPDDHRWPAKCEHCAHQFADSAERQIFHDYLWTDEGGRYYSLRNPQPGMMYDAFWLHDSPQYCGLDGRALHVVCPDGHAWNIDGRAGNCTNPEDWTHRCWVRHGDAPNLTVDKNGHTCAAGAGSIQTPHWHGFLRNGELVE